MKDVATHLTFTFTFFPDTYLVTPLGAASWTLAMEVQAYVLFPLIARCAMKKPAVTLTVLCLVGFGFRAWCIWALSDYSMVVNQLLNFLDVYVIGILAAMVYVAWRNSAGTGGGRRRRPKNGPPGAQIGHRRCLSGSFIGLLQMLHFQARSADYVRLDQLTDDLAAGLRSVLRRAGAFRALLAAAPAQAPGEPGDEVPRRRQHELLPDPPDGDRPPETAIVSPPSVSDMPNMAGEQPWQNQYTLAAFGISLLLAILVTYAIEKPAARLIDRLRAKETEIRN